MNKIEEYLKQTKSFQKQLYTFNRGDNIMEDFCPIYYKPKQNGRYLTIRCGFNGIYTIIDDWKDDKWELDILDSSEVIAYSRKTIDNYILNIIN